MGYVEELRKLVGHRPLILVGSAVVLVNGEREILLEQRTYPRGRWGLPGGLMELGESTEDTARREVFEETGLTLGELHLIDLYSGREYFTVAENGDEFYTVTAAYHTTDFSGEATVKTDESLQFGFFDLQHLPDDVVGSHREMIKDYAALQGKDG